MLAPFWTMLVPFWEPAQHGNVVDEPAAKGHQPQAAYQAHRARRWQAWSKEECPEPSAARTTENATTIASHEKVQAQLCLSRRCGQIQPTQHLVVGGRVAELLDCVFFIEEEECVEGAE